MSLIMTFVAKRPRIVPVKPQRPALGGLYLNDMIDLGRRLTAKGAMLIDRQPLHAQQLPRLRMIKLCILLIAVLVVSLHRSGALLFAFLLYDRRTLFTTLFAVRHEPLTARAVLHQHIRLSHNNTKRPGAVTGSLHVE